MQPSEDLAAAALAWRSATGEEPVTVDDLADTFLRATVHAVRRPNRPGVYAGPDGAVSVFTSLPLLAAAVDARPGTPRTWLRTTGADLLAQLPAGTGVVVDPLGPYPVLLPSAVLAARALLVAAP